MKLKEKTTEQKKEVIENGSYGFWSKFSPDRLIGCVIVDEVLDFSLPQPFLLQCGN